MNQLSPTEKPTGKRIVSKGEYVKALGKYTGLTFLGKSFGSLTVLCGIAAIVLAILLILMINHPDYFFPEEGKGFLIFAALPLGVVGICMALLGIYWFRRWGISITQEANRMNPVIPLTRANTVYLPAPDSLVRASAEPAQEQQAVLLRAATDTQERHEEELVRASAGGTE